MDPYLFNAPGRDREVHDRSTALQEFQKSVAAGDWCEVWQQVSPTGAVKIAEFPGIER